MGKKFGDRRDGTRIKMGGFERVLYFLKTKRSESEVYISRKIDVSNLVKYMEDKKKENEKITYFHLFSMAIAKVLYNEKILNRFIIGGHKYQRNEVTLSFVAKTDFTDEAKEFMSVIRVDSDDNVNTLSKKISGDVKKIRSNQGSGADKFVQLLDKMPKFVIAMIVWIAKRLDNHDLLPQSLTKDVIYHSSVILSNLGSIHCGGIYHNLTNFGTNSILATMGEIKKEAMVIDGKVVIRDVCEFGITLDERIADGVYFAKCVNLLEYILNNPQLLEDDASAKIIIDKNK